MRPGERSPVGVAAAWHFRLAVGLFAAAAAAELAGQAWHGAAGAGPAGWLALLVAASWVVGLVWRERVGVARAWQCWLWVELGSLLAIVLAVRHSLLVGRLRFEGEALTLGPVPLSAPLLWWVVVGGGFLVVEGLWGEFRAGISAFTAFIALLMALMLLPFLGPMRGYWHWRAGADLFGMSREMLGAWLTLALGLALGLVILGENWSSAEARSRRQAWAPATVLLTLTVVCLAASVRSGQGAAMAFSAANAAVFGTVLVRRLRAPA